MLKYTAYLSTGEIINCDNFKTIFSAARFRARNDGAAAIICRETDKSCVCTLCFAFHKLFIFRLHQIENTKAFFRELFSCDEYGRYCWDMAGLDT